MGTNEVTKIEGAKKRKKGVIFSLLRYIWIPIILLLGAVGYEQLSNKQLDVNWHAKLIQS